jgi:pentatricopeptide repeat protein
MQLYNITPSLEHYTCMVDVLARAGFLDKAEQYIASAPERAMLYNSLLSTCRILLL